MKTESFASRHIGITENDLSKMLKIIDCKSIEELIYKTIPDSIRLENELNLEDAMTEHEFIEHIYGLGKKNKVYKSYIGLGYHQAIIPAVIQRNVLENPSWYTAYTPYQAEISQGRLEALLNYQTMVADLTGMPLANASLLDEATAAAEAMALLFAVRSREKKKNNALNFFVSEQVLPQTLSVLKTRALPIGINLVIGDHKTFDFSEEYFGVLLQYPGKFGQVYDYSAFANSCKENNINVAVAADILSLALLEAPENWGADVVVGTTQRFGIPLGYGGPHAAFFATKQAYKRNVPGRIIGLTKDANGNRALRMALQTREQHIKRDKATSNICTAQVLLAVMAGMYAVYHGPKGIQKIANTVHQKTVLLADALNKMGITQQNSSFFDTLQLKVNAEKIKPIAEKKALNFLYPNSKTVCISINETTSINDINTIIDVFSEAISIKPVYVKSLDSKNKISHSLQRSSDFLTDKVFNSYHSETELMRYIKGLERKDLALNHSMISLGSCTMKLNAAAEMFSLSNPEWNNIHPFVPENQAQGYQEVLQKLEAQLSEITGFAATSLQPNSGAQGEFSGLMIIRAFHRANGNTNRNICLIPASAHGTNPASAVMSGMKVIVIKTDQYGNIDVEDLCQKAQMYKDNLAALMVTYPSTHGVFESSIKEITKIIHDNGGQVYMDGANMNAQVGFTNPAKIGADVCHLNLHKTFAIPHGGGGPGVGPICVAPHLVDFLPSNPVIKTGGNNPINGISAAPWGSALVCLISYGYVCMLGKKGLKQATAYAILNANYIKERLREHYQILYSGELDRTAHEMIIDCRPFKTHGIEVADIAKRLIDYGFHAPTVSFPVAGTMMIEPTESESISELNRFCDAMIAIKAEIDSGLKEETNNPLKNAPHTQAMLTADRWDFPYSRKQAAFPLDYVTANKFWPSVARVDDAYGDRNLVCTCTPIEDYAEET